MRIRPKRLVRPVPLGTTESEQLSDSHEGLLGTLGTPLTPGPMGPLWAHLPADAEMLTFDGTQKVLNKTFRWSFIFLFESLTKDAKVL